MKRRRLKSATLSYVHPTATIHDRKATQLPAGVFDAVVDVVEDPYDQERISVVRNVRDDPLAALHCRHFIDAAQFSAGRHWQRYYEASQLGDLRGQDLTRPYVDGSSGGAILTDTRIRAIAQLGVCRHALGERDDELVRAVLGYGQTITEVAAARGLTSRRQLEFLGQRLRDALETLAKLFGFA
jgi:hypothetical protein